MLKKKRINNPFENLKISYVVKLIETYSALSQFSFNVINSLMTEKISFPSYQLDAIERESSITLKHLSYLTNENSSR